MSNKFIPLVSLIEADWLNQVEDHLNMPHDSGTGSIGPQGPEGPQGPAGPEGPQGPIGPAGSGVTIRGTVDATVPLPGNPVIGDMYIVGTTAPVTVPTAVMGDGLVWTGTIWNNVGPIRGPIGPTGPKGDQGNPGLQGPAGPIVALGALTNVTDTVDTAPIGKVLGTTAIGQWGAIDITVDGSGNLVTVPTLADLVAFNQPNVLSVWMQGRDMPGDQGAGLFTRCTGNYAPEIAKDPRQGIYISAGVNQCWVRQYPKGQIRPEWFGNTYTHVELQAAANLLSDGDAIILTPGSYYQLGQTVTILSSRCKIISLAGRAEDLPKIQATLTNLTLFQIEAWGSLFQNIAFYGPEIEHAVNQTTYGTCLGISFDQSTIYPNDEIGANIDSEVSYCAFVDLKVGVYGKGRNVVIKDNIFNACQYAIQGEIYQYSGINATFRGWDIIHNRFHMIGVPHAMGNQTGATNYPYCIFMPHNDDITPGGVAVNHIRVLNNNADFCGGAFYTGSLTSVQIDDNYCFGASGPFLISKVTQWTTSPNQLSNSYNRSSISNNVYIGRASESVSTAVDYMVETPFAVDIELIANLKISGNIFKGGTQFLFRIKGGSHVTITDNDFIDANIAYQRPGIGDHAAVIINRAHDVGLRSNVFFNGNRVSSRFVCYTYAVQSDDDYFLEMGHNLLTKGRIGTVNQHGGIYVDYNEANGYADYTDMVISPKTWPGKPDGRQLRVEANLEVNGRLTILNSIKVPLLTILDDGTYAFKGGTLTEATAFDISNVTNQNDYNLSTTDSSFGSIISFIATLVKELKLRGIIK